MQIGIFADTHDHLDHIRLAVSEFNRRACELVIFAGDFVSTFALPPLRKLNCPLLASFGDNEGNRVGILGGMQVLGEIGDPPFGLKLPDGTCLLITHQLELLRKDYAGADVIIFAHTHKPSITTDDQGRLFINPGETSGWTYRKPSLVMFDSTTRQAEVIWLTR